jgi:hypothetical protein
LTARCSSTARRSIRRTVRRWTRWQRICRLTRTFWRCAGRPVVPRDAGRAGQLRLLVLRGLSPEIARWRLRLTGPTGRAPGLCAAADVSPGGGSRLTGPVGRASGLRAAADVSPGGGSRLTGPTGRVSGCAPWRMYRPVAAHALPGLLAGLRVCAPWRMYRPVAAPLTGPVG